MVVKRIRFARNLIRREVEDLEKKRKKRMLELESEILATVVIAFVSGYYVLTKVGQEKMIETLMFWLFPASLTILITLVVAMVIEVFHERRHSHHKGPTTVQPP